MITYCSSRGLAVMFAEPSIEYHAFCLALLKSNTFACVSKAFNRPPRFANPSSNIVNTLVSRRLKYNPTSQSDTPIFSASHNSNRLFVFARFVVHVEQYRRSAVPIQSIITGTHVQKSNLFADTTWICSPGRGGVSMMLRRLSFCVTRRIERFKSNRNALAEMFSVVSILSSSKRLPSPNESELTSPPKNQNRRRNQKTQ